MVLLISVPGCARDKRTCGRSEADRFHKLLDSCQLAFVNWWVGEKRWGVVGGIVQYAELAPSSCPSV